MKTKREYRSQIKGRPACDRERVAGRNARRTDDLGAQGVLDGIVLDLALARERLSLPVLHKLSALCHTDEDYARVDDKIIRAAREAEDDVLRDGTVASTDFLRPRCYGCKRGRMPMLDEYPEAA
jgi:hypothetical protein